MELESRPVPIDSVKDLGQIDKLKLPGIVKLNIKEDATLFIGAPRK